MKTSHSNQEKPSTTLTNKDHPILTGTLIMIAGLIMLTSISSWIPSAKGYSPSKNLTEAPRYPSQLAATTEFAVIGDYGSGFAQEAAVAHMVDSWNVDFIITTGDNYYSAAGGSGGNGLDQLDNAVGAFYCSYLKGTALPNSGTTDCPVSNQSSSKNRFFPTIGNHESSDLQNGLSDYLNYFTLPGDGIANSSGEERYYDFIQGPVHFFALDSESALIKGSEMAAQKAWLAAELARSDSPWNIVYFHHAAYSSGKHGSRYAMQWPFADMGVDAVFQGHDHTYERVHQDGIVYIVSGFGGKTLYDFGPPIAGSQIRYNENYGAVKVKATEDKLIFEAWAIPDATGTNSAVFGHIVDTYVLGGEPQVCPTTQPSVSSSVDDGDQAPSILAVELCPDDPTALTLSQPPAAAQTSTGPIIRTFILLLMFLFLSLRHHRR